jgi:hypothetical protein
VITIQEAQWQLTEKIHGLERLEGAAAIYEWQEGHGINRRESRDHVRRIWVKDGDRFGCEECGTMPDYLENEEDSAKLLDWLLGEGYQMVFDTIGRFVEVAARRMPGPSAADFNEKRRAALLKVALAIHSIEIPQELEQT